jgi:hypothetical protein
MSAAGSGVFAPSSWGPWPAMHDFLHLHTANPHPHTA